MIRLFFVLFLIVPAFSLAQPLDGKFLVAGGLHLNTFRATESMLVAPFNPYYSFLDDYGPLIELNYVMWRKDPHELFGGLRLTSCYYEKYDFTGAYNPSYFQTIGAQFGYRHWLKGPSIAKFGIEAGLLLVHNRISGDIPANVKKTIEVMPFTPALRFGNLARLGWLVCSFSASWIPIPVMYRTYNRELTGDPNNPVREGRTRVGFKTIQLGFVVGLRL